MLIKPFQKSSNPALTAKSLFAAIKEPVFPLDIESVALSVGIHEIREFPDKKLEGMLLADPDKTIGFISVGAFIREPARRRFTIAHELGHFLITSHTNQYSCTSKDLDSHYGKDGSVEAEANRFASHILMPETTFLEKIKNQEPSISLIQHLKTYFGSSLSSTLLRYAKLSDTPLAIVMSENSIIKWAFRSQTFKYFIPSGVPLSEESIAIECFKNAEFSDGFEEIEPDTWFDASEIRHQIVLKELAIPMPFYNKAISVLWLEEDEEELEDESIEYDGYLKIKE